MIKNIFLAIIFIIGTTFLFLSKSYAVEAEISTSRHGSYGRLHFIWPFSINYEAKIKDSTLEISFSEKLDTDISRLNKELPEYVKFAKLSEDKKKLFVFLTKPFSLRSFSAGTTIFTDLIGEVDPATPQISNSPAKTSPQLSIRTGKHSGYTRIVFSWDKTVPYFLARKDDFISIIFPIFSVFDQEDLASSLPEKIRSFRVKKLTDGMEISFPVSPDIEVKDTALDNRIILDFIYDQDKQRGIKISSKPSFPKEDRKPEDTKKLDSIKKDDVAKGADDLLAKETISNIGGNNKKGTEDISLTEIQREEEKSNDVLLEESIEQEGDKEEPILAVDKVSLIPEAAASLSFQQGTESAVAVFKNNGYLWVIFDRAYPVDINLLRRLGGDIVKEIVQFPSNNATVIRIITDPRYNPSVRREGTLFILDLMEQPLQPSFALEVTPQADFGMGSRVFIPVTGSSKVLTVYDPVIGMNMQVIPVLPLGRGIDRLYSYPEADILPSAQGLAIIPKAEEVEARSSNTGVSLLRRNRDFIMSQGVSISPSLGDETLSESLNIKTWGYVNPENFKERQRQLQLLPLEVSEDKKDLGRLEYARFLFANNYIPEALGVLDVITRESPDLESTPAFLALRGAANFMMYRYKEAIEDFSNPIFAKDDDISLWKAASQVYTQDPKDSLSILKANMSTLRDYPDWIKIKLSFAGLEAATAAGDELAIQNFLEFINNEKASSYQKAGLEYYKGKLNQLTSSFGSAISNFEKAEASNSRYYRALSARERIKIQQETGSLNTSEAAQELEKLRFAWRSGDYELGILNSLVDLYLSNKDYAQALRSMKDISISFGGLSEGRDNAKRMNNLFVDLYLNGKADEMPPIKAIALYEEFKELTPPDYRGNEMLRRLADRLVAVDLLEQAAEILNRQLSSSNLSRTERSLTGTRLALVYLLNKSPVLALEALDNSENESASERLKDQRKYIRAKALADTSKPEEALALLSGDDSYEANSLYTEILWGEKRWEEVSEALRKTIKKPEARKGISEQEAQNILYWVTAMKLAGQERGVARARQNFIPYMKRSPYYDAFNLITSPIKTGVGDYQSLSEDIKSIEGFKNFTSSYSNMIKDSSLSSVIH